MQRIGVVKLFANCTTEAANYFNRDRDLKRGTNWFWQMANSAKLANHFIVCVHIF
jgi:hypothetical protein